MQSRHPDVGKKHRMELGTPDALAGPLFSSGPNMKLSPGTRQSPEGRCWDHLSNKHVLRPLDTVLSTGRPASASRNSLALHDRGDLEAWPTHCPAGEGVPSRKGAAGSVTALATAGGGSGKAAKWWDLGAEDSKWHNLASALQSPRRILAALHHQPAWSLSVFIYNVSGQLRN